MKGIFWFMYSVITLPHISSKCKLEMWVQIRCLQYSVVGMYYKLKVLNPDYVLFARTNFYEDLCPHWKPVVVGYSKRTPFFFVLVANQLRFAESHPASYCKQTRLWSVSNKNCFCEVHSRCWPIKCNFLYNHLKNWKKLMGINPSWHYYIILALS